MDGLQNEWYENIWNEVKASLFKHFGNKVKSFVLSSGFDSPHTEFCVRFYIYNFYIVRFCYDRGCIGFSICLNNIQIPLDNSQKWYDKADLDIFCAELDEQIRLRIPDKYLAHFGWL
jgi:hypothetical protein